MDRKGKLEIIEADLATRTAGLSVGDALADVRAELDALKPKRWRCATVADDFIEVDKHGDLANVWIYQQSSGNAQSVRLTKAHAIEMAHELLRLAGADPISRQSVIDKLRKAQGRIVCIPGSVNINAVNDLLQPYADLLDELEAGNV